MSHPFVMYYTDSSLLVVYLLLCYVYNIYTVHVNNILHFYKFLALPLARLWQLLQQMQGQSSYHLKNQIQMLDTH